LGEGRKSPAKTCELKQRGSIRRPRPEPQTLRGEGSAIKNKKKCGGGGKKSAERETSDGKDLDRWKSGGGGCLSVQREKEGISFSKPTQSKNAYLLGKREGKQSFDPWDGTSVFLANEYQVKKEKREGDLGQN